jgi:hypothetical protein
VLCQRSRDAATRSVPRRYGLVVFVIITAKMWLSYVEGREHICEQNVSNHRV